MERALEEARDAARARVAGLVARERELEQQRAHWRARVDALSVGLARKNGAGALLSGPAAGVLGAVAELLEVEPAARTAVAAVLGELADGVAVESAQAAAGALRSLRADSAGQASLLVGGLSQAAAGPLGAPPAGVWLRAQVRAPAALGAAVAAVLGRAVLVDDLDAALAVLAADGSLVAVTAEGDVLAAGRAHGGAGSGSGSALEVQAAVDESVEARESVEAELARLRPVLEQARAEEAARAAEAKAAEAARRAAESRRAEAGARLGRLEQAVRSAEAEAARLRERQAAVDTRREAALRALAAAEEQLAAAESEPVDDEPGSEVRDAAAEALATARAEEVECRLALRTAEERARAIAGRAESLRRQAVAERHARARAAAARAERERAAEIALLVIEAGAHALGLLEESLAAAERERDRLTAARAEREQALAAARRSTTGLSELLDRLIDSVHRDEVARAQSRSRLDQLIAQALVDFGLGMEDLVAEYGPAVPVPPSPAEVAEYEAARERGEQVSVPPSMPYDRATQERRARRAGKDLALLGKVNPLALEEFAALEERYTFLSTQLEDLKNTRRDLLTVVREVDEKILEVFSAAFTDVAAEFQTVFGTLFPGGEGRLLLTDPADLLTTGIEVEARPPGKKVKRLSLLSGGERSLTAMALLVAIFRARPSPFYVLDEIEAALDDVNLRRLISLLEELRTTSQLIVITHQKPTMEVADALYGVSMRGDGITAVVSQRLRPAS